MSKTLIRGGRLLDAPQGYHSTPGDILIEGGLIQQIGENLPIPQDCQLVDAAGLLVSPGMIDLHMHTRGANRKVADGSPDADILGSRRGATTVVEAGSVAPLDMEEFVREAAQETTKHLVLLGCHTDEGFAPHNRPLDFDRINLPYFRAAAQEYPHLVKGLKCMCSASRAGDQGPQLVAKAVEMGDALNLPVVVHIGRFPPDPSQIVDLLRPGDMVTHSYHDKEISPYHPDGTPKDAFLRARERGVLIDLGHGKESFSWDVYQRALRQGFAPDTLGTDIYVANMDGPVYSQAVVMSKMMSLGMTLEDAVEKVTAKAAAWLRLPLSGALRPGFLADLTLFTLEEGYWELADSYGRLRPLHQMIRPAKTVLSRVGATTVVDCDLGHPAQADPRSPQV